MEDRRRSELRRDSGGVSCDWLLRASIVYELIDGWPDGRMEGFGGWMDGRAERARKVEGHER